MRAIRKNIRARGLGRGKRSAGCDHPAQLIRLRSGAVFEAPFLTLAAPGDEVIGGTSWRWNGRFVDIVSLDPDGARGDRLFALSRSGD